MGDLGGSELGRFGILAPCGLKIHQGGLARSHLMPLTASEAKFRKF